MIPSQRHMFDIPDTVAYLNCAYMSPLMKHVAEAGHGGVDLKRRPWEITPADFFGVSEDARALFARIIGADADDIAIVPAVSYGMAAAARNLPVEPGQEIIGLKDQFPSNVYPWRRLADDKGATVRLLERGNNGANADDWTALLLDAISDRTAIVALPHTHWTDGALVNLIAVGKKARAHGAALVLDVTQSAGALPIDVQEVQPDFLVAGGYKWLMGPYTLGFLYVAPKWQQGRPVEENWIARKGSEDFARLVDYQDDYQAGARRFDMGERSCFHLMPMARASMSQLLDWGVEEIQETLRARTDAIAERAAGLGMTAAPRHLRAGHYLGLRFPEGVPDGLLERLADKQVHVSVRGDSMRVTPHVYNTDEDVDRLFAALEGALGG